MPHPDNPKNKRFFSSIELAQALHISQPTVTRAYNHGQIVKIDGGIDLDNDVNKYFIRQQQIRKGLVRVPLFDPTEDSVNVPKKKKKIKLVKGKDGKLKPAKKKKKTLAEKVVAQKTANEKERNKEVVRNYEKNITKAEADIARINAQTTKYNVKIAEDMGLLIARQTVDRMFGNLYSISTNQFLVLGDRLAPIIAGICGTTDPTITMRIKNKIEEEVTRVLKQVKDITEKEL